MKQYKFFKGVYCREKGRDLLIYTQNLVKGQRVYGENLFTEQDVEYREWDPKRSKLCAALKKDVNQIGIKENDYVLYLGASTGTTVSHVSDIVGVNGLVYAMDFAPRVLRDLVFLAETRNNIAPILADANHPETYLNLASEVDVVFMDIAQRNQAEIFLKNCRLFLKQGGYGLLALKARSVDVTKNPKEIYRQVRSDLEKEMIVVDYRELDPYEKDHAMFIVKKK
ncbi:TPA: fibrillarin-like rRNA/tRNA 2'-O-methyltransferase [Candidatus Woesearchaeota archaeon]|nr:fibrillarin-like rRNA/tRNA 2'-O-methyltransferase [Candidatus Woesearchaeota archaeon]HIH31216.1 fibrillarin-like rRNA/tRNA 2'-O-methyltransferase [Candidatus Woesearchaeota archaeon]HIH55518.1 fibrillarin-like rRNA/tRNA 2'-O-methyltransferase [Candidatus Woesearchaeota archaeon]HIJ02209.1 fibrillarin-like rRNA/tRNA 2'-O-methyltransferase [Candidatus Woesearchaeota archaeon]HIJ13155.1 fibrillarin-like rRNA/tRNA 2'-O-methyltransferase [Candidatus Woesearchaeota archaeon]